MYVTASSSKNVKVPLQLWEITSGGTQVQVNGDFGYFIANKGIINIKSTIIKQNATLKLLFTNKNFKTGLNNLVTFNYNDVAVL